MPRQPVKLPGEEAEAAEAEKANAPIPTVSEPVPEGTPNAIDVDPLKITGPVLTRQGWVVPEK